METEYVEVPKETIPKRQGESITKWYKKTSKEVFTSDETAYWTLSDTNGTIVKNGTLSKSDDNLNIGFTIPKTDTTALLNSYLLCVRATHEVNTDMDDVFAEYDVFFNDLKAR